MKIVLVQPDIPFNTGNIGRTCVATSTELHLIEPLGFDLSEQQIRRSGLDYWNDLNLSVHASWDEFVQAISAVRENLFFFSRSAKRDFWGAPYTGQAILVFGSETLGLPPEFRERYPDRFFHIPMTGPVRSLNLSTAAGIALYEALRQQRP